MKKENLLMTAIAIFGLATITMAQVPSYVPTNGLVGYWPFNGNANDESGNGNNGSVNNATLTQDRYGSPNSAYDFNANAQIVCPQNNIPTQIFSLSVWINQDNLSFGPVACLGSSSSEIWGVNAANNYLNIAYGIGCSGTGGGILNTTAIPIGNWIHLTYVSSGVGGNTQIYKNGIYVGQAQNSTSIGGCSSQNLYFGVDIFSAPEYIDAKLDDIGIWDRALTECEIQDLYNAQLNSSASIQAGTDVSICEGNDVIFNGSGGSNYTWNNGVQNGVAYTPTISQEYIVIGQDTNNCYGTDTIYVELIPNTNATQIQTALDSYTWPINSQTYTQSGTYTAVIPNTAGCDSTITLDLSLDFTGLEENSEGALFSVFPNPAQSIINVKADDKLIGEIYSIYDNTGRVVLTGKLNSQNTTIELENLSGGIYMFSVGENMKQTFKVIKE